MHEAFTPATAAKKAATRAVEDEIKHSSHPSKQPEIHRTYGDRFPLPQRAVLCDPTSGRQSLDDDRVKINIAIEKYDRLQGYYIPESLHSSERELCTRIKGKVPLPNLSSLTCVDKVLSMSRQIQSPRSEQAQRPVYLYSLAGRSSS